MPSLEVRQRLVVEAEALVRAHRIGDAYGVYAELILARREELGGADARGWTSADATILDRAAELATFIGKLPAAEFLLETLASAAADAENDHLSDYAVIQRMDVRRMRYGADDALQFLEEAAPHLAGLAEDRDVPGWEAESAIADWPETDRRNIIGRLLLVLGEVMLLKGRYGRALELLTALARRVADPRHAMKHEPALRARLHLARASIAIECGDWDTLPAELQAARALDASPGTRLRIEELLAQHASFHGDYDAAQGAWRRACTTSDEHQLDVARVQSRENLAEVLILINQTTAATQLLEEAIAIATDFGDEFGVRRAHALLALRDARLQSSSARESLCKSVWEMANDASRRPSNGASRTEPTSPQSNVLRTLTERDAAAAAVATTSALQGHLASFNSAELTILTRLAAGDAAGAVSLFDSLLEDYAQSESPMIRARRLALEARVAYYAGDLARATASLETALPALERLGLRRDLREAHALRGWCAARAGAVEEHRQAVIASEAQVDAMARSLPPEERAVFLLNKFTGDEERLAADVSRLRALKAEAAEAGWFGRLALWGAISDAAVQLRARTDGHRSEIAEEVLRGRRTAGDTEAANASRPTSLLQAMLGERSGEATLSFLVLPQETIAIITWRGGIQAEVLPITRLALRNRVAAWHKSVASGNATRPHHQRAAELELDDDEASTEAAGAAEVDTLLHDLGLDTVLLDLPKRIVALRIVPDDVLHGIPWAGLRLREQFLVQRCSITIGHEASSQRGAPSTVPLRGARAMLVGVSSAAGRFSALPAVPEEIDRVAGALRKQQAVVSRLDDGSGTPASRDGVLRTLPQAQLLHAACHGTFVADRPDQSGLVLVPNPGKPHEILSVRDLAGLELSGLDHVVLSSCWSADSYVAPGRWIVSLPETLWRTGVRVVVASLWPVIDEIGPPFLERYYGYLASHPPAVAMQRVQLDCIEGRIAMRGRSAADMRWWAGFQLHS